MPVGIVSLRLSDVREVHVVLAHTESLGEDGGGAGDGEAGQAGHQVVRSGQSAGLRRDHWNGPEHCQSLVTSRGMEHFSEME